MKWRAFARWACFLFIGSALAGSAPAPAQEAGNREAGLSGALNVIDLVQPAYGGGSGRVGYGPPGMSGYSGGDYGTMSGFPGGYREMPLVTHEAASLPDVVAWQREQLIASLRQLQDAYCRAAMLDEAVAVREQVRALESLRSAPLPQITDAVASVSPELPQPTGFDDGQPYSLRGRNDESFFAEVTGRTTGSVWGDGVYTDDSDLATAAVHAGVLKEGETKVVKFKILPGKDSYEASSANGVDARPWPAFGGSFRVDAAATRIVYPYTLRDQGLERLQVFVVGSTNAGTVWGTDVYTDDSALDAAAVHAGVVAEGEKAIVTIELLAGRDSYEGSQRNGVTSSSYNSWEASYRFVPDDASASSPSETGKAIPTSESPYTLRGQNGKTFVASVTGSTSGSIWGDSVYTDDSDLGTAAVHAGVLQDGETGSVRFTILPAEDSYASSTKNGVTTGSWPHYPGSYRVERAGPQTADGEESTSGPRETLTVTGSTSGTVWGSGVYTSDSDIETAAVHAGVLQDGETGPVTIERLPGRDSYEASTSNGVESREYGSWSGSFRFVDDPPVTTRSQQRRYEESK